MKKQAKKKRLIREKFTPAGYTSLDSKNRITLGKKVISEEPLGHMDVDSFEIFVGDEGDILLKPLTHIPSREAWLYRNPQTLKHVQKGIQDSKEGKVKKVKDLKQYLDRL